jgi:hypothetical protein
MVALLEKSTVSPADTEPQALPIRFLARCRAIVESYGTPLKGVPIALKHRVRDFKPKARTVSSKRSLRLAMPELNESQIRRTETILGIVLIVIAHFLFKPSEDLPGAPAPEPAIVAEQQQVTESPLPELPFTQFHSFADPSRRFNFNEQPQWKVNYLMSTRAACGMAQHIEHSVPVMMPHPLLKQMMTRSKQTAFVNYVNTSRMNPGTVPMARMMDRFRTLSKVLNDTCGPAPNSDAEEGPVEE